MYPVCLPGCCLQALQALGRAGDGGSSDRLLGHALTARTCPTTPLLSRAVGGNQGSPGIRHLLGGRARLGHGPAGGPASAGPTAGQVGRA